jgi:hypothetical protein
VYSNGREGGLRIHTVEVRIFSRALNKNKSLMATLSPKELEKRNNFNIFLTRIRTNKEFILSESNGVKVKLDKSILTQLTSIIHFDRFKVGSSILLPTTTGQTVRLTEIYKDSEFSGRSQSTTAQEDAQIIRINQQLTNIFDKIGKEIIRLKVGTTIYDVGLCESTPGTPKCDFHFRGISGYVGHVSHKAGSGPKAFQQWAGTSQRVEPLIYNHPETQAFINTLKQMFPNGIPNATTVGRRIQDENLKKMAVYGSGYGSGIKGENNVDVTMQGLLDIRNRGLHYELTCSGHKLNNGDRVTGSYEPVFLAVYKGDRSDHGIRGARVIIQPIGGRTISNFV